jgi:hypothetical protein
MLLDDKFPRTIGIKQKIQERGMVKSEALLRCITWSWNFEDGVEVP